MLMTQAFIFFFLNLFVCLLPFFFLFACLIHLFFVLILNPTSDWMDSAKGSCSTVDTLMAEAYTGANEKWGSRWSEPKWACLYFS